MTSSREGAGVPVALFASVILLLGVAVVGIALASPDTEFASSIETVVDPASDESDESIPQADLGDASVEGNLGYLRDALGASFRLEPTRLTFEPGIPAEGDLPADFEGVGQVTVGPTEESLSQQCPIPEPFFGDTCKIRTLADGTEIAVQVRKLQDFDNGQAFALLGVYFIQPSGDLVQATLTAIGEVTAQNDSDDLAEEIDAWLTQFEDALIEAATDPRMTR